jgi:hypothetical protein
MEPPAFPSRWPVGSLVRDTPASFFGTVLGCAAQIEEAAQKGRNQNDNERAELYRAA